MTENFNILVNKLDRFRRRFYLYSFIRGIFITLFTLLLLYTLISVVEYMAYLPAEVKKSILSGSMLFLLFMIGRFLALPLLKMLRIIKPLDDKTATVLIQKHFSEIEDKLINVIELYELSENQSDNKIILASIDQKIGKIKLFDFKKAVNLKNAVVLASYFMISLVLAFSVFLVNKNIFTESAHRLAHYNVVFTKPAPISFQLVNDDLEVKKGESLKIKAQSSGEYVPQILYINIEGNNYVMKNTGEERFEFEMETVINSVEFFFTDTRYDSEKYRITVLPKPGITQFIATVLPPPYTGIKSTVLENVGDLEVPEGTKIEWNFTGIDTDSLYLLFDDSEKIYASGQNNSFLLEKQFFNPQQYSVFVNNRVTEPELALSYAVEVIPDIYPEILVEQVNDSMQLTRYFFKGIIGDDYGFSNLNFHINQDYADSAVAIPFVKNMTNQEFYFSYDFKSLENKDDVVTYYFTVTDNDVINNYKSTTSQSFTFKFPNRDELLAQENEKFNDLQHQLYESKKLAGEIESDLNKLKFRNMENNISEWDKKQMVKDIVAKQNRLEELYNNIKKNNEQLNNLVNSYNEQNEDILNKQMQLEELMEEVFTDELKELMEEFEKLAEEFDSKKLNQLTDQMDLSYEDLQEQLDRNLEMLRKMKVEQQLQNVIDEVDKMGDEELKMAEDLLNEKDYEKIGEEIDEHKKDLDKLKEEMDKALELNQELKNPLNFDSFDEEFSEVEKSMEESKSKVDKKSKKGAEKELKKTSDQLKSMAFGMQQMLDMNKLEQNQENIDNLRQILSNLILLSFTQENIYSDLQTVTAKDPMLVELNQRQKRIFDQSRIVKDSLYALAMRTPHISSMVNNELVSMELNLERALEQMEEGIFSGAKVSQMFVMTSTNNLALMLNEALENLEKMMANAQPGDQQCENPGQGTNGFGSLKESAQGIKEQLQKMIEQMKKGNQGAMSKQLGQSLMQHEMMQNMLRELMGNGNVGSSTKEVLKRIDQLLEENRRELMNKNINARTIARQNLITTRLLEAEKAELEREYEEKRESETAEDFYSNPMKFFEYKNKEDFKIEYLNRNTHKLNSFYINKYKNYLGNIEEKDNDKASQ